MKKRLFISCVLAGCLAVANSYAQDNKVVVIPMGKTTNVAGTTGQVQYNDNGTQAGANVYYDKTNGFVGIGSNTPSTELDVYSGDDTGLRVKSDLTEEIFLYTNPLGENRIEMFGLDKNSLQMYTANNNQSTKSYILGGRTRIASDAPSAIQGGDHLFGIYATGYGDTDASMDTSTAGITFFATEPFTDATQGTGMVFTTTRNGEPGTQKTKAMHIHQNGNVGIGTTLPPTSTLQVEGFIQLLTTSKDGAGSPFPADCDEASELGRMIIDDVNKLLYICVGTTGVDQGWVGK